MSILNGNGLQIGQSATATQNFTITTNQDGTVKLARGNIGATTQDILSISSNGVVTANQGFAGNGSAITGLPTPAALSTASGSAPSYSARAWVNFNGTGTVAIRASGNVSSITDNGVGTYAVNFTTAMPDVNYSTVVGGGNPVGTNYGTAFTGPTVQSQTASLVNVVQTAMGGTASPTSDPSIFNVAIFR